MPQPLSFLPHLVSPGIGGPENYQRLGDGHGGGLLFPSFSPIARASFLLRVFPSPALPSPPALSYSVLLSRGSARN